MSGPRSHENAPDPPPAPPADPATPHPSTPQESPAAGTSTRPVTVDWSGQVAAQPSEATVLGYLEDMDEAARERVLAYSVARWARCEA